MERLNDLLRTVSSRYTHTAGFNNLFTLTYRMRDRSARRRQQEAHEALERGILRSVERDMLRHVRQWREQSNKAEARRLDAAKRAQRKADERFNKTALEMKTELLKQSRKNVRNELRRLREEQEYEQRRRGR